MDEKAFLSTTYMIIMALVILAVALALWAGLKEGINKSLTELVGSLFQL